MKSKLIDHIKELTHDPANARKHTPRNVGTIVSALQEVGAARSIVIDEDGVVLAGNATMDAAAEAGITRVRVVDASGDELIAVRRSGLSPAQKTRLALYDNRASELAEWDNDVLQQLAAENQLDGLFNEKEINDILGAQLMEQSDDNVVDDIKHLLLIEAASESEIATLYDEMMERGYTCKLMN